ncbi:Structural maintenance of chromosomes protein 2, partial [Bienertia sinuspersici]
MDTMRSLWNLKHGVEARRVEDNMFSFQFFHWRDKARILEGQPWHFDRHALCLSEINDDGKLSESQLHSLPMWVRFYSLPYKGRGNEANSQTLANKVGTFMKLDKSKEIDIDRSIRIRVAVDEYNEDSSPIKKLGTWIRASPWKNGVVDEKKEKGKTQNCSRRLFVAKPRKENSDHNEDVSGVMEKLEAIELDKSQENRTPGTIPLVENGENKITQKTESNNEKGVEKEEAGSHTKQPSQGGKRWKRVDRNVEKKQDVVTMLTGAKRVLEGEDVEMHEAFETKTQNIVKRSCMEIPAAG